MNPPTPPPPPPPPPATSGGQDPPPPPLKLGKESVRPGPKSFKTDVIPPSSHTPATQWKYDVFLSFRGEDTRKNFTEYLYRALVERRISTFRDDEEPRRGNDIFPGLLKAIEESQIVIVILSTNYANSTWCLDELAKAVECRKVLGHKVFPVFYDVYPYEVRTQTGYFGKAFSQHEQHFKDDGEKIRKWRAALTEVANLSGWDLRHGNDAKGIQDIVERVFIELNSTVLSQAKGLVGMEYRVEQVLSCLSMSRFLGVRVIGICGLGGIGKTTIAQVVFERISSQFDACSFLANVREVPEGRDLVNLQQKLLSDTMLQTNANIRDIDMGIKIIKQRLCAKKVLVIVDDVDRLDTLKALCGSHEWFGPGSRIIVTSRDRSLLCAYKPDEIYEVERLNEAEAFQLFGWTCFKKYPIEEDFLQLSEHVLKHANGLPLAIKVLGSFLYDKNVEEWSTALKGLEKNSEEFFKVCFDGLSETDKEVFLDIACFHKGEDVDRVTRILESSIGVLLDKSLVNLSSSKLWMPDFIQEMGRKIVRHECLEDPGKRSRLWFPDDIIPVLTTNKGTSTIEGIFLNLPEQTEVELTVDPFLKMRNLKYLKVCNVNFSGNLEYLCDELRLLDWHACPLKYLPSDFQPDKLVELIMQSSNIKQLWSGVKRCSMLKLIDLSDSQYLIETPDFTEVPNIETLVLEGCTSLAKVHPSIGCLKKLALLNMRNCISVRSLLLSIGLESLKVFNLSGCSRLTKFPEIEGNMGRLLELHLDGTAIVELPQSIKRLTGLSLLNLEDCKNLQHLPRGIRSSIPYVKIILTGCPDFVTPDDLGPVERLEEISGTAKRNLESEERMPPPPLLPWRQRLWDRVLSFFCPNLRDSNLMERVIPNDGRLYSEGLTSSYNNESIGTPEIIGIRFLEFLSRLYNNYYSLLDFQDQSKECTSGISATTSCHSLIKSLPLIHHIEKIVEPDEQRRAKETERESSELYSPIELVQRAQREKQKHMSISQHPLNSHTGKELADTEPCPPTEHKQMAQEKDETGMSYVNLEENMGLADAVKVAVEEDLIQYCCLFPSGYEFREDELVQLWIAEGLIKEESNEKRMEDSGIDLFNSLVRKGFLVRSRCDFKVDFDSVISVPMYSPSTFFYKVNAVELLLSANKSSPAKYCRAIDGKFDGASQSMTQHLSLVYEDIDEMTFGVLQKFKNLRTLLLLSGRGSSIKRIPGDLFLSLNVLTTLNLSRTLISGLPSSIGDVQPLRYLDVSYTLITRLPESIGSLNKLQTLKLRGCKDLFDLPRSMHRLTALRHLDFDIIRQLDFMPAHLGNLRNLQSLSAFLVGRDDGRRIGELKNLNDLGGALRIFRLENVLNKANAEEVDLENKKRLQRLDFRWTKLMGEKENKMQEEILDSLRPPTGLKELQILFYSGTKFPSWLSDTSITDLVVITLYKCANCKHLPSLGRLPNLKFLSIVEMNAVEKIAPKFFRSLDLEMNEVDYPKSLKAFPKLEILEVDSMLNLKAWEEIQEDDLESLIKLTMESCPELVTVPSFSDLKSLKYLEFNHCPKLLPLDRKALPTSLESLIVRACPKLKESWPKEGHQDLRELKSCS